MIEFIAANFWLLLGCLILIAIFIGILKSIYDHIQERRFIESFPILEVRCDHSNRKKTKLYKLLGGTIETSEPTYTPPYTDPETGSSYSGQYSYSHHFVVSTRVHATICDVCMKKKVESKVDDARNELQPLLKERSAIRRIYFFRIVGGGSFSIVGLLVLGFAMMLYSDTGANLLGLQADTFMVIAVVSSITIVIATISLVRDIYHYIEQTNNVNWSINSLKKQSRTGHYGKWSEELGLDIAKSLASFRYRCHVIEEKEPRSWTSIS